MIAKLFSDRIAEISVPRVLLANFGLQKFKNFELSSETNMITRKKFQLKRKLQNLGPHTTLPKDTSKLPRMS